MRRARASLLTALVSFPLIGPVLFANTGSDLPTCCRRNGKHRCAMPDIGAVKTPVGPALRVIQPKCPLFLKAGIVPAFSKTVLLGVAPRASAPRLFSLTTARTDDRRPRVFLRGSVQKRGPPICLSQTNQIPL